MSRQIQIRRGTAAEHENFIGAVGEITMDTTTNTLRVHDGKTAGGTCLARVQDLNTDDAVDVVVEYQHPTADNNYTWFRRYKSGWVEQGGISGAQVITLPVPMADTHYGITMTGICGAANNDVVVHGYRDVTTTNFVSQGNLLNNKGNAIASNNSSKTWVVHGMSATVSDTDV